ncbi:hypothetical protein Sru01_14580 [Sphaerisporangium rufum]|uniref:DUF397 domain-containing protein n=1 Tax=Sphaerisporangium rufum TaxID=1381558 RepID=A0A919QYJ9_9ACTN|nr:DUF397 domain-containing protein [Sphaerisporangium rufum]GII76476.1 hypothetical protein Sru01_14580 [Sphaerisporangium rufum]
MDLGQTCWRKSSYSGGDGGMCVEVALGLPGIVAVRDSKSPAQPPLATPSEEWRNFLHAVRRGGFSG